MAEHDAFCESVLKCAEGNIAELVQELGKAERMKQELDAKFRETEGRLRGAFAELSRMVEEAQESALMELGEAFHEFMDGVDESVRVVKIQKDNWEKAARDAENMRRRIAAGVSGDIADAARTELTHKVEKISRPAPSVLPFTITFEEEAFAAAKETVQNACACVRADVGLDQNAVTPKLSSEYSRERIGIADSYRVEGRKFLILSAAYEKQSLDLCVKVRGAVGNCTVTNYPAAQKDINLAQLRDYDSVLVWIGGCNSFASGAALGDNLARYVEEGGGVVVCPWGLSTDHSGGGLRGEIVHGGQLGVELGECKTWEHMEWHAQGVSDSSSGFSAHPLLQGVTKIDGGEYSGHHTLRLRGDTMYKTEQVEEWPDKTPLAVLTKVKGDKYQTAVINIYPVSADCSNNCWNPTTDVAQLLANALHIVARTPK